MCPSLLHAKHRAPFGAWCEALSIFAGVTCWLAWCSPKFGRIYLLCCSQGAVGLSGLTRDLPSFGACFGVGRCAGKPSGTKCCDSTLGASFTSRQAGKKKKESILCLASSQAQGTGGFAGGARQGWAMQRYLSPSFPCTYPLGHNLSVGTSLGKYLSLCSKVMAPTPCACQRLCIFEVFYKHKPPYLVIAVCSPLILLMNSYK